MTVSKLTSPPNAQEEIDKINEIIDNLGGGGGGAVDSVNGQTGTVVLTATDVGALPSTTTASDIGAQPTLTAGVGIDITSNTITAKGVEDVRTANAIKIWTGTEEQEEAVLVKDANTLYCTPETTNIGSIVTDLNGKADVDLTNLSNTGNIAMAKASMPSTTYIDLTLGASGTFYTAPADGYVYFSTTTGGYVNVGVEGLPHVTNGSNGQWLHVQVPVAKGQSYNISYSFNSVQFFRFYYAVGSESEAS